MPQVTIDVAGRNYTLACRDGDQPRLTELAATLTGKADDLKASLGDMSETRLLVMTALMIADELHELRAGRTGAAAVMPFPASHDPAAARLEALIERAERVAATLNG